MFTVNLMIEEVEGGECCDSSEDVLTDAAGLHASKKVINISEYKSTHRAYHCCLEKLLRSLHMYVPQLETACIINIPF